MAISGHFQDEITAAGLGITLSFDSAAAGHDEFEWSYSWTGSTYLCEGGSELACEHAASELLEALGFRFYTPDPAFWIRPSSLITGLDSGAPQLFWIQTARFQINYSHSWEDSLIASRTTMQERFKKWCRLNNQGKGFGDGTTDGDFPYPAGHNWWTVIQDNVTYFTANPTFTLPEFDPVEYAALTSGEKAEYTFNLAGLDSTETDELAQLCAAWRLTKDMGPYNGLNEYDRETFSPPDSDYTNTPNLAYPFIKAVADYVRSGVGAIGPYGAQSGVPGAQLGVYIYTGISYYPTVPAASGGDPEGFYGDGVYGQFALAYKSAPPPGYDTKTYEQLLAAHAPLNDGIILRGYADNAQWRDYLPGNNSKVRSNALNVYDTYKSIMVSASKDLLGINNEIGCNWFINMVFMRQYVRKIKTGSYTWAQALEDVVDDFYGGDPAVRDLYEYLNDPTTVFSKYSLKAIFNFVEDMVGGTYQTYWKHACVVWYEYFTLPNQNTTSPSYSDDFALALSRYAGHVAAIRELEIVHSYGILSTDAFGVLTTHYPALRLPKGSLTEPAWHASPTMPNDTDFTTYKALLDAIPDRDADIDSTDLVLVRGLTPASSESAATTWKVKYNNRFTCIGPGTITVSSDAGVDADDNPLPPYDEVYPIGAGISMIDTQGEVTVTWSGGAKAFRTVWPQSENDTDNSDNDYYAYFFDRYEGEVAIETTNRCVIVHPTGTFTLYAEDDPVNNYVSPADVGLIGQCRITRSNTLGRMTFDKANPYLSAEPAIQLMPRTLAYEEFPVRTTITRG